MYIYILDFSSVQGNSESNSDSNDDNSGSTETGSALHISTGPLARWLFQPFGPVRATRTQYSSGPPGPPIVCSGHTQLRIAGPIKKKKSADGAAILFRLPERISAIIKFNFIASSNIMTYSRKTRYPARSVGVVVAWRRHFYFYYKSACFVLGESR